MLQKIDVEQAMAMIEKGQQLAGHFPDAEALGRARKILTGEMTDDEALDEVRRKWVIPQRQPGTGAAKTDKA